jgi:signal peptidase
LYFLSGLVTTYSDNGLVSGPRSIVLNIWSFGVAAFAIEYARHGLMMLAGRRHFIWFGTLVALVLAVQQMSFGLIPQTQGLEGFVKLAVSDFVPAIASSFLLTYLAIAGGLPSMLVYRLGLVAATILPPIIPKYDWYLRGISLLLLAVAIYVFMERNQQDKSASAHSKRHRNPARAYNMMSLLVMIGIVLFVTGFFSYKPVTIVSNSMKPVYSRGSVVVTQKVNNPLDIKVGDIVQYKRTSIMITHRVIAINEAPDGTGKKIFITQGDNSPSKDAPVTEEQIVGIVRSQVPFIGYPTVWLREAST